MYRRSATSALLLLALALPAAEASAAHAVSIVGSDGGCPAPAAVGAALRVVLPDVVTTVVGGGETLRVELWDDGPAFRVTAGPQARDFEDVARRCGERANEAAVFVALVLEPPSIAGAPSRPPPPPAGPSPRRHATVVLGMAATMDGALAARAEQPIAGGGALELFVGNRFIGGVVGAAGLSPVTLQVTGARARLFRVPVVAAVRGQLRRGALGLALDLGLLMSFQITEGVDITPSLRETRLDLGLRVAAQVSWWLRPRVAVVAGAHFEWLPSPNDLLLAGAGTVGTTPSYWLGASLGVAVRLD
jgi:hypothetical protein